MANVFSRLAGPVNLGNGTNANVFTAVAAHVYDIRSIRLINTTAAPITVIIGIGGVAAANQIINTVIPANSMYHDDALFVISGASSDIIESNCTATGVTCTISGLDQS